MNMNNINRLCALVTLMIGFVGVASASDSIKTKRFADGWNGLTTQTDPFDEQQTKLRLIYKESFTFTCGVLNVSVSSTGFESYSFPANIKYVIDDKPPVDRKGTYSTYHNGSSMVTNRRYYSFVLTTEDLAAIESGNTLKVAGKTIAGGWETKSLDLKGLNTAYGEMCN